MAKTLTLPGYDNETFGAFLNAMSEQETTDNEEKWRKAKELELQKKKYLVSNMPTFASPDIQGPDDINKRVITLKKKMTTHEDNVYKLLKNYWMANYKTIGRWDDTLVTTEQILNHDNFKNQYEKIVGQQDFKFLLDEYMENALELVYWTKDQEDAYLSLKNIYKYYKMAYPKIYKGHSFTELTHNDHALAVATTHEWEFVEKNSLIKKYVVGTIYHFSNGTFKYLGGPVESFASWEPVE
jgi:hypothetical protein